uniref:Uncharacterized protein n=1 Tax=Arundo donax TaxID=35708 RepID=A0A0A9C981_ARUDO
MRQRVPRTRACGHVYNSVKQPH